MIDDYLCIKSYIFTKLSQIVCPEYFKTDFGGSKFVQKCKNKINKNCHFIDFRSF